MCAQCKALEPQRLPERKTKCRREATEPILNPNPNPDPDGSCGMRPGRVGDALGAGLPRRSTTQWLYTEAATLTVSGPLCSRLRETGAGSSEVRLQVTWQPGRPCPAFFSKAGWDPSRFLLLGSKSKVLLFGFCFSLTSGYKSPFPALCNLLPW